MLFYTAMGLLNDVHPWWWIIFYEWHTKHKPYQPVVHRVQHMHCTQRVTQPLQVCNSDLQFGLQTQNPMQRHREDSQWWSIETYSWLKSYGHKPSLVCTGCITPDSVFLSPFIVYFAFHFLHPNTQDISGCLWVQISQFWSEFIKC